MESRIAVEWVPIGAVKLNPKNPRVNDQAVAAVKASIDRFGFRQPLVANRKTKLIEAGNTRYKAARELGLTEVPVIWVSDDKLTAIAYGIADNRTHEFSSWDEEELAKQLRVLEQEDMLFASAFGEKELRELLERAEQIGRRAFLMEIDPLYTDVIVSRWEAFTGKKAGRKAARGRR